VRCGLEPRLPRRRAERLARDAADDQHRRPLLPADRASPDRLVRDEDEGARRGIDLVPVECEDGVPCRDEVELLVPAGARAELVVLLDHPRAVRGSDVGVHAEALDPEPEPDRVDAELARADDRRDLLEARRLSAPVRRQRPTLRARAGRGA